MDTDPDQSKNANNVLSGLTLAAANLTALYMVRSAHWSIAEILIVFWLESLFVGLFHLAELLSLRPGKPRRKKDAAAIRESFGIYMGWNLLLGVPLFSVLLLVDIGGIPLSSAQEIQTIVQSTPFAIVLAALIVSHGVSFYLDFWRTTKRLTLAPPDLFLRPQGRTITLQATLIIGTITAVMTGELTWIVTTMIIVKSGVDLWFWKLWTATPAPT